MLEVRHKELEKILRQVWEARLPLYIWGSPGIGKSQTVREFAERLAKERGRQFFDWTKSTEEEKKAVLKNPEKYFIFRDIRLSEYDPSDLRGLPNFEKETSFVIWKSPLWIEVITNPKIEGVVFFDEMNLAPPAVLKSAYEIILDRSVNDKKISDGILIIGAGNRSTDGAQVTIMPRPLQNRFLHVVLKIPTAEEFSQYATQRGIDPRITAFLLARPSFIFKMPESEEEASFPTPRQWEFASKLIKKLPDDEAGRYIALAVGEAVAFEFNAFLRLKRKIDFKQILENPKKASEVIKEDDIDLKYALVSLCYDYYRSKPSPERIKKIVDIMEQFDKEFLMLTLRMIVSGEKRGLEDLDKALTKYPHLSEMARVLNKYLE